MIVNFGRVSGFLSLSDHIAPGNYALFDLVAALHYIRENIAAFGGDADEVTVMGHGHAAALLNLLLISPVAKGDYAHFSQPHFHWSRSVKPRGTVTMRSN